jgi:hypothetical protein
MLANVARVPTPVKHRSVLHRRLDNRRCCGVDARRGPTPGRLTVGEE